MTGEKIIVLRRLEKDDASTGGPSSHTKSSTDEDSWFLGYCEGVVGKFRASHVKIHGKLKKPVLMRRSGQGQIRESSTKFMSQAAAATLPESQVPVGIPISSIDSDGEESAAGGRRPSTKGATIDSDVTDVGSRSSTTYSVDARAPSSRNLSPNLAALTPSSPVPANEYFSKTPTQADVVLRSAMKPSGSKAANTRPQSSGSDSDDSETLLPWARPPSTSSDTDDLAKNAAPARNGGNLNESPQSSQNHSQGLHAGPAQVAMSPSANSLASTLTDDSEDDSSSNNNHRRDYTFSIYDVYGRDSVAFPNFNLKHISKALGDSNSSLAQAHPSPPIPEGFKDPASRDPKAAIAQDVTAKLRYSPSSRRPNAAPDPRAPPNTGRALASNLRQQVETNSPRPDVPPPQSATSEESSPITPQDAARFPHYGPDSYDPRRRPSAQSGPSGPSGPASLPHLLMPSHGAQSNPPSPHAPQGVPRPGQPMPSRFPPANGAAPGGPVYQQPGPPHPGMGRDGPAANSPTSAVSPTGGYFPPGINPNASALKPVRASSDRSSERDRIGSGQLRKNPSNPSPGSYGGGQVPLRRSVEALSPPPGSIGGASRTPSPRSNGDGSSPGPRPGQPAISIQTGGAPSGMARLPSPSGKAPMAPSPTSTIDSNSTQQHRYDAKGFILGSGPPCRSEPDDHDAVEKWNQILAENDLPGAKKSRKVKKLVQAGIPNSVRGKVWLFLANAGVRRRPGLFENLCKISQEAKGKKGKEALYEAIDKDVARTFPENKHFGEGRPGRADLHAILKSYAHYNPIIGYTQGMGMLVGVFLLHMPPEDAFWMLCATLRDIHMEGYYSNEMKQMHIDGVMFGQLLQTMDREVAGKLQSMQLEPIHFTPNWFLPLFCRIIPWPTLFPVWDMFFYEGPTWILQVALAVVRIIREPLMAAHGPDAREECLRLLLHPPPHELTTANVLTSALSVKLKEGEVRKLSRSASKLVRESGATSVRPGTAGSTAGSSNGSAGSRNLSVPSRR